MEKQRASDSYSQLLAHDILMLDVLARSKLVNVEN